MGKKQRRNRLTATTAAVAGITILDVAVAHAGSAAVPVYNWSGFYIGVEGGGAAKNYSFNGETINGSASNTVGIGGVFAGYQKRRGNFVFGVEVGGDALSNGSLATVSGATITPSVDSEAYLRGRVGYLINQQLLGYVAGGPTLATIAVRFPTVKGSDQSVGFTVAVGADFMVVKNVSIGAEYRYSDFSGARPFNDLPTDLHEHAFMGRVSGHLPKA